MEDPSSLQIEINTDWLVANNGDLPSLGLRMISLLPIYFLMQYESIGLFHGALVSNGAHVCLVGGPSGMGKTTFCRELAASWQIWADDLVLCCFHNGICGAQPLPTWSIWVSNSAPPRSFQSSLVLELNKVILLGRGEANWRRLTRPELKLALAESFGTFLSYGTKKFRTPLSVRQLWLNLNPLLDFYCDCLPGFLFQRTLKDPADILLAKYLGEAR